MNSHDMMKYAEWRNSPVGQDVAKFATSAIDQIVANDFKDIESVRPVNTHTVCGLMAAMLPMPIGHILRDLSTFFYENPEIATKAWESIKGSVDPLGVRNL